MAAVSISELSRVKGLPLSRDDTLEGALNLIFDEEAGVAEVFALLLGGMKTPLNDCFVEPGRGEIGAESSLVGSSSLESRMTAVDLREDVRDDFRTVASAPTSGSFPAEEM